MANILIVDDSSTMRKIISRSLRQAGLTVDEIYEAGDGIEGLGVLASGKPVTLILSDINMPNMDGLEFIKQVRANGNPVPIVMITTEGGRRYSRKPSRAGPATASKSPLPPSSCRKNWEG